ncbi:ABC transporter permease [Bacillus sp. FJAT-49736]|uniref:ABC transporter permease n=1 Tax=Bacillus sp. FJAT-49736 TaxID=2833582 RepID=UPI001BC9336C|nr:ABC transporter permease [Bacillus sp. FJAT-49736]MBS4172977.1 ABC transporter permease [Bacillus sp. FJAT-49736]
MKSIAIAMKDFSIRLKDRKALLMMICMPILLTVILGSALKGVMGDSASFPKTNVAVYLQDEDSMSKQFVQQVLKEKKLKKSIHVEMANTQKELNQLIKDEKADVGIILPQNWGTGLQNTDIKPAIIKVSSGKELEASFVQQLIETYVKTTSAVTVSAKTVVSDLATLGETGKKLDKIGTEITTKLINETTEESQFVSEKPLGKKPVSAIQYYAAAMAAMFLLFNARVGGKSILAERENITLARMIISPTSKNAIIIGKFLGTLFYTLIQFLIFIGATHFILKVNWGNSLLQVFAIAFAYSISVSGLSMIVAAFMKTEKMVESLGGMLVQVLSLLGGSMIPISSFPQSMQTMSKLTPNSWALTSFTNIMSGTSWDSLIHPIILLLGIGIAAALIGILRLRSINN